jgi:hypothetical protein
MGVVLPETAKGYPTKMAVKAKTLNRQSAYYANPLSACYAAVVQILLLLLSLSERGCKQLSWPLFNQVCRPYRNRTTHSTLSIPP